MVLCIVALPVFAILGIFSATYRELAKEAVICVFKKATLQPCNTGLDTRIKTSVVGPIFKRSQTIGKFVYKHFELMSWFFVILSIATLAGVAWGGYNFYLYGNCNGPNSSGFCVFDPSGENQQFSNDSQTIGECAAQEHAASQLQFSWFNPELHATLKGNSEKDEKGLWMIGCYNCKYTRETWPIIRELQKTYNFTLVFAHLPLNPQDKLSSSYGYCIRQIAPEKFWSYADAMFISPQNSSWNESFLIQTIANLRIDSSTMNKCLTSEQASDALIDEVQNIAAIGIYGTPTIYADNTALVGPKPRRVYKRLID
jgi:hypothetical protein